MAPIWPVFSKSKTNHKVLSSESIYETVNGSHEYKIKGFSLAKGIGVGKSMSSRTFTVCGHDWVIIFYPDGDKQDSREYVSVYLKIVSPGNVRATFEFKLLDQSQKGKHGVHKIYTVKSPLTFTQGVAGSCCL
ncbi:BTB/POZ and MATH domain-containing protein 4-like [Papaver somniferum]|uniref:BTB/POZ and MATH domain-containing protein 4-like n=1 Tax=Papaver somniferum TaxID=3469 RepID=UPI000E7028FD|nr:BTB/POZ and MATH domain-containing protein 4-like [Papaver somniferum]